MMSPVPYPVSVSVEPFHAARDRMTTAFRLILAIPHLILVGGIGFSLLVQTDRSDVTSVGPETGLLGFAAVSIPSFFLGLGSVTTRASTCAGVSARSRI